MRDRTGRLVMTAAVVAIAVIPLLSQTPAPNLSFEAATIKPNTSDRSGIGNRFDPELFSYTNVTLRILIENIYQLRDYQLVGAPNWVNTEKWDINARTDGPTSFQQKFELAKTLLAERFQLKFHSETRELPVYSLIAIKTGPKFEQPKNDDVPAGLRVSTGLLIGHKWDVSSFANLLSTQLNIPVIDKAGLKGIFDFKLEWTPVPNEGDFAARNDATDPPAADVPGPTIFTALQGQLGLKLESGKGPVEVLVIDSVQRPSEN